MLPPICGMEQFRPLGKAVAEQRLGTATVMSIRHPRAVAGNQPVDLWDLRSGPDEVNEEMSLSDLSQTVLPSKPGRTGYPIKGRDSTSAHDILGARASELSRRNRLLSVSRPSVKAVSWWSAALSSSRWSGMNGRECSPSGADLP